MYFFSPSECECKVQQQQRAAAAAAGEISPVSYQRVQVGSRSQALSDRCALATAGKVNSVAHSLLKSEVVEIITPLDETTTYVGFTHFVYSK